MSRYTDGFEQGTYRVVNTGKFLGSSNGGSSRTCIFRSSWERRLCVWLDSNPAVRKWGSERIVVPYISPVDGGMQHRYFVDFDFEVFDKNTNTIKRFWCEVKPHDQTMPPKQPKRLTESSKRNFTMKAMTYLVNQAKWTAAKKFAKERGATFFVLTEQNASFFNK